MENNNYIYHLDQDLKKSIKKFYTDKIFCIFFLTTQSDKNCVLFLICNHLTRFFKNIFV